MWLHITEEHCELAGMRLEILETIKTAGSQYYEEQIVLQNEIR
ncbi:MAG: hypothetical protein ACUZ8H_05905 [Candidatus Anammoxibacter sp.]